MKITAVRAHALSVPLEQALWTAQEALKDSSMILVEVETDAGLTGYGEIKGAPLKTIVEWTLRLGEFITGADPLAHEIIWDRLFNLTVPRPRAMFGGENVFPPVARSSRPQVMAAIAGIDIALWDIKGKAAGLPVYKLLGGSRQSFFTYATGSYYRDNATIETYANEMASFVTDGYRAVKAKCCWAEMSEEVERIAAIREAIGKDTLFMLDMNAPYDV